jgi:hypothetical protein
MRLRRIAFVVALCALVTLGCGRKGTVSGTVNYKNKPLPSGTVTFFGANKEIVGNGSINNGNYSIANVPPGPVKITVSTPPVRAMAPDRRHPPPKDMPGGPTTPPVAIPTQYGNPEQSGLEYTVQSGSQQHPIDLK